MCANGTFKKNYGKFRHIEEVYEKVKELLEETKDIEFPKLIRNFDALEPINYEYVILERNDDGTKPNPFFRNEYGKLIEHKTDNEKWVILDKFPFKVEEKVWVASTGHNVKRTFRWIYNNLIIDKIDSPYDFLQIIIYNNKVLIKEDNGHMEVVVCKNTSDSIRFYNLIEENLKKDKIKQVIMLGIVGSHTHHARKIIDEIAEATGWSREKVKRAATWTNKKSNPRKSAI